MTGLSNRWSLATTALFLVATLTIAATFRDYGATWDERFQEELGRDVVAWFASGGNDARALSGGSIGNLHLYGGVFEAAAVVAASVLPFDRVETRHLVNALVALLGVAGAALLARRLGGNRAAFFAAALLLTTPFWWGYGFSNSKDIPFAAAYPWILLALLRASDDLPRPGLRKLVAAGAALGAGLAVRPGGLILLLPLAAGLIAVRLLPVLLSSASPGRPGIAIAALGRVAAILGIGWFGMLAFWPYGLMNPLSGPVAAVAAARSFRWEGLVRFAGGWYPSTDLPRSYAPVWFLATLPETWFVIAIAGAVATYIAWRGGRIRPALEPAWLDPALVAAAGLGPILAAVVVRPVLYDGIRHLLFVVPALAALAGWVLSEAVERLPRWAGRAVFALAAGAASLAVVDAIRLHPYQYVYFNRAVAGGLAGASRDFELDYWGATGREAMEWVVRNVPRNPERPIFVGTSADPFVASHWVERDPLAVAAFSFQPVEPPDLRLATTRWFSHRATGRVLHIVERMGVPLLYVLATGGRDDGLVLEAGDRAVWLAAPPGWYGVPELEPRDERARYLLRRDGGALREVQVLVMTPRSGPVPTLEQLRADVAVLAAELTGGSPGTVEPQPIIGAGAGARGWIATGDLNAARGPLLVGAAGVRVGDAAVILMARYTGDGAIAMRELLELARGARISGEDRRVP